MQVVLLLGSNLGDSRAYISSACEKLSHLVGPIVRRSTIRSSAAWGFDSEMLFFNQIVVCETDFAPLEVLARCESVELSLGRAKSTNSEWQNPNRVYQDRIIDVDLLYYFDNCGAMVTYLDNKLQLPHPRIAEREFVKVLLCEMGYI